MRQPREEQGASDSPAARPARRRWPTVLAIAQTLALLTTLAGPFSYWAELLNSFRGQLLVPAVAMVVATAIGRRWYSCLALVIAVLLTAGPVLVAWGPRGQVTAGSPTVRAMSWNLLLNNDDSRRVREVVDEVDPDLLLLLEYDEQWHEALAPLRSRYRHHLCQPRQSAYGIALYSRFPLTQKQLVEWGPRPTPAHQLMCDIQVPEHTLHFIGVHLSSPVNARRWEHRDRQLVLATEALGTPREPTLMMGDFNCVPWSTALRNMLAATGLRDSRLGFGFQGSWPRGLGPLKIPIDQALVTPNVQILNRSVGPGAASDHLPIILDLSIVPTN